MYSKLLIYFSIHDKIFFFLDSVHNVKDLKLIITKINGEIVRNGLKLTYGRCEITNNKCIALINTKCDTIALLQSTFSPVQLEYFQAIISEILGSDEYRITFIICINITSTLVGKMTRDQGQNTLNVWIKGGYFIKDEDYVYLGLRTKMEFATYLRQHCPDSLCKLCSELVFRVIIIFIYLFGLSNVFLSYTNYKFDATIV